MIGSLRGVLTARDAGEVMVEVAGVGYRVTVAPATSTLVGEIGEDVFLHIHHHIREDAQTLYGFLTHEERVCFEGLIAAHGVGPSLGLAILSVHDPAALRLILATDDLQALCIVPGVGKKTATRLLVELKSSLDLGEVDLTTVHTPAGPVVRSERDDVREALAGLGYSGDEINRAMTDLPTEGEVSELLTAALRSLASS